jgi:hypothetical protein
MDLVSRYPSVWPFFRPRKPWLPAPGGLLDRQWKETHPGLAMAKEACRSICILCMLPLGRLVGFHLISDICTTGGLVARASSSSMHGRTASDDAYQLETCRSPLSTKVASAASLLVCAMPIEARKCGERLPTRSCSKEKIHRWRHGAQRLIELGQV